MYEYDNTYGVVIKTRDSNKILPQKNLAESFLIMQGFFPLILFKVPL